MYVCGEGRVKLRVGFLLPNKRTGLYRRQTGKPAMGGGLGIQTMKRKYKSTNLRLCTTIVVRERNPKPPGARRHEQITRNLSPTTIPMLKHYRTDSTTANKVREMQTW